MAGGSRSRRCTVGRNRDEVVGRDGNLGGGRKGGGILIALGPKAERFKARTHQVHVNKNKDSRPGKREREERAKEKLRERKRESKRQCQPKTDFPFSG